MRPALVAGAAIIALLGITGCHCCALTACYDRVIDEVGDHDSAFECWYSPRCDISRLGKPDYGGPLHRMLCRHCNEGCYRRESRCVVYQQSCPYVFPGFSVPVAGQITDNPETLPLPCSSP